MEVQFERMLKKKFDDQVRQIETVKSFKDLQTNYSGLISTELESVAPVKMIEVSHEQHAQRSRPLTAVLDQAQRRQVLQLALPENVHMRQSTDKAGPYIG